MSSTSLLEKCPHPHHKIGLILSENNKSKNNCQIKQVIFLSRAWHSGLRADNQIVTINQKKLNQLNPCQDLKKQLQQITDKQQAIYLEIISKSASQVITISAAHSTFRKNHAFIIPPLIINPFIPTATSTAGKLSALQILLQEDWLNAHSITTLNEKIACLAAESPTPVLPLVKSIQNNPLKLISGIERINNRIISSDSITDNFSLADFLVKIHSLNYQLQHHHKTLFSIPLNCNSNELLELLEQFISHSYQMSQKAFADITIQETSFFITHYQQLSNSISQSQTLMNETNESSLAIIQRLFQIADRVDYAQLSKAAAYWLQLSDANWLQSLKTCLARQPKLQILEKNTPFGKIILGSHGDDIYSFHSEDTIALLIDPAGNDQYRQAEQTVSPEKSHLYNTALIDLEGNDQYDTTAAAGFAFAVLGNALLVDLAGNDHYIAKQWAQGSAFAGIAALYDHEGNDHYSADSFSQAVALFGSGLLVDRKGNDVYSIKHHGQALGLPYGQAVLMDNSGNDHYIMRNGLTSSYNEDKKTSESWGQGVGKGFRYILPGGLGLLVDTRGNDTFSAHEFAQGGGYYYGIGLLYSLGSGDDHYQGSRYNAGFSAHQAIGGLIDMGGNDHYQTTGPAFCGTAWDQSISLFYDQSGNDTYTSKEFSLGASAHNSIASFWDISGQDKFNNTIDPALVTSNDYHDGQSLSYFFSGNKKIPQRINRTKQEFVITFSNRQWQQSVLSLLKKIKQANKQTSSKKPVY